MSSPTNNKTLWTGRVLSGLAILALGLDAAFKLAAPQLMIDNSPPLGLAPDPGLYRTIGSILLVGVVLYAWPRTAFLGALLITAFLGGAVAVNLRAGMPLFSNTLFGVYLGLVVWGGLWLRDPRVRALLPIA
ncbi:DoxX family protein [Sphingomonas sp. So64.6b]|uniref:DoxX family protein n=1 Tax=Sphingomonas sp. So64.6b TaxID=2997354 RepID=UPI0016044E40|nr:DoxX family protein [Sphingomonas sp. So64.6b]QNA86264.1 DoxX family protein [Sphingomonas sp. So64.6b]